MPVPAAIAQAEQQRKRALSTKNFTKDYLMIKNKN
jgi:hypothetical protein